MFIKFKDNDGKFKELIKQDDIKTLYQQLVLIGYTDTEEEFLNKLSNLLNGNEKKELIDLINSNKISIDNLDNQLKKIKTELESINVVISNNTKSINEINSNIKIINNDINTKQNVIIDVNDEDMDINDLDFLFDKRIEGTSSTLPSKIAEKKSEDSKCVVVINDKIINTNEDDGYITLEANNVEPSSVYNIKVYEDKKYGIRLNSTGIKNTIEIIKYVNLKQSDRIYDSSTITKIKKIELDNKRDDIIGLLAYCKKLKKIPYFNTSNMVSANYAFQQCESITEIPLFDFSNVKNLSETFRGCILLKSIPLLNTSKVENANYTFYNCKDLTTIPLLDFSNVKEMEYTFAYCFGLKSIPLLNTSNVLHMNNTFNECKELITIPLLDFSNVLNTSHTFNNCQKIEEIPALDFSKTTTVYSIFGYCYKLKTLSTLNWINVEDMDSAFYLCQSLKVLPTINTSRSLKDMRRCFYCCTGLRVIPEFETINVYNMLETFYSCSNLERIEKLNVSSISSDSNCANIFYGCNALNYIKLISDNKTSLQRVINKLPTNSYTGDRIIDLSDCTIDFSGITIPNTWTLKAEK